MEKKEVDEKLADALGIDFTPEEESTAKSYHKDGRPDITENDKSEEIVQNIAEEKPVLTKEEKQLEADRIHSRNNIKRLLDRGEEMFEDAYRVAQETDSARGYEVAGKILRDILDSNQNLIDLHKKAAESRKAITQEAPSKLTQNNVNSGTTNIITTASTAEILDIVQQNMKKVDNEAIEE